MKKLAIVLAAILLAAGLQTVVPAPNAAAAATVTTDAGFATVRKLVVDPDSGTVFVSGDDGVAVFNPDGTLATTIPDIYGASGMDVVAGSLWVAMSTAGKIAKIDIATRTVTTTYTVGKPVGDSLAVVGSAVFFGVPPGCCGWSTVGRFDTISNTATTFGSYYGPAVMRIPGDASHVMVYEQGISSGPVNKLNTTAPYAEVSSASTDGYLGQIAISSDGGTFWSATGSPYSFPEWNVATMSATGVVYPGTNYPRAIAYSPGYGGIIVGSAGEHLWISKVGQPVTVAKIWLGDETSQLGLAPNGSAVYAMKDGNLLTNSIGSSITGASPATVVADVPTTIQLTGTGLGGTSSATVGGITASITAVSPISVTVSLPAGVTPGSRIVAVTGPLGTATRSIVVQANTGATLSGTVRSNGVPAPAVQLTLSGGSLPGPVSTTSDVSGHYAFAGLPYSTSYSLLAHDPATGPDQTISSVTVVPNQTSTLDIDRAAFVPPPGWKVGSTALPAGTVQDLLVEPTTGRVFVANGNEVDVLDADGRLISRVASIWGATSLTTGGGKVYVGSASAARVTRIDPVTMTATGSWPLNTLTNGAIGFAGGQIYFTNGNDQWTTIWSLNPADGTTKAAGAGSLYVPRMETVEGDPSRLLAWESDSAYVYTASNGLLTLQSSASDVWSPSVASASSNKVWNGQGQEFSLATLALTGVTYPGAGAVAHSAGHGGVLAFGPKIFREGTPVATHTLDITPVREDFNSTGSRVYAVDASNTFVTYDLAPHVTGLAPVPIFTDATTLTVTGSGLATASSVKVDGTSRSFTKSGTDTLQVNVSGLSAGAHSLVVTTAWGSVDPVAFSSAVRPVPPVVTSIDPGSVSTAGGSVTITGSGFASASGVRFGTTQALSYSVVDDTHITAVAPAHAAATVQVVVTNVGGFNATSPDFSWIASAPVVTGLSIADGPANGGTSLVITGTGLSFPTGVTFGGAPAVFTAIDEQHISVWTPSHEPGAVDVLVTTAGGTSVPNGGSTYLYTGVLEVPAITSISPGFGSVEGGYSIVINGSHLTDVSSVQFGGAATSDLYVVDDTKVVVDAPSHSAGVVDVVVWTGTFASAVNSASHFFYFDPNPPPPPAAPVARGFTAGPGAVQIAWWPPDIGDGAPITSYLVTSSGGQTCGWVSGPPTCTIAGLTNGTPYTFALTATSADGTSDATIVGPITPVSDVPVTSPFFDEINWLMSAGIATGYSDGTFRPTAPTSRGAMAAFLYRAAGSLDGPSPSCTVAPFPDVAVGSAFCGEIAWLAGEGIAGGFGDGTFRPSAVVSRQAMASFLYKAEGSPNGSNPGCSTAPFPDVSTTSPFCGAIAWLVSADIASGYADGGFHPTEPVSRQAMAKFLFRLRD